MTPLPVSSAPRPRLLVVGLGNSILTDDGVGIHALRHFRPFAPQSCLALEAGTAVLDALNLLEEAEKIIAFDAMQAGGKPGTVYLLPADDVLNEGIDNSLHELGLLWILQTIGKCHPEVWVIAAEPEKIDYGMSLSPSVRAAVPTMVETALAVIAMWQERGEARLSCEDLSAVFGRVGSAVVRVPRQ